MKATDSLPNQCSMNALTTKLQRHSSTHISPCVTHQEKKRGFIEGGEALRLLRTSSTKATFEEKIKHFESRVIERGYPKNIVQRTLSEVIFENRKQALQQKPRTNKRILPFVTQYHPSVTSLKQILMENWHLIERQPLLREIYKEPPLISYKRGRSLKDILVRAKLTENPKNG